MGSVIGDSFQSGADTFYYSYMTMEAFDAPYQSAPVETDLVSSNMRYTEDFTAPPAVIVDFGAEEEDIWGGGSSDPLPTAGEDGGPWPWSEGWDTLVGGAVETALPWAGAAESVVTGEASDVFGDAPNDLLQAALMAMVPVMVMVPMIMDMFSPRR